MSRKNVDFERLYKERTIIISDLFKEILRKIWVIVILVVVCALIFAGKQYKTDKEEAESSQQATIVESTLSEDDMMTVESVYKQYQSLEYQKRYMDESVLMNIDPYNESRVFMRFKVESESDNAGDIVLDLKNYVSTNGSLADDLQATYPDVNRAYLVELVNFSQDTITVSSSSDSDDGFVISGEDMFTIRVINTDEESCQQLADAVRKCINSYQRKSEQQFGSYELTMISSNAIQTTDTSLANSQSDKLSTIISLQNSINSSRAEMSSQQINALNSLISGIEEEDSADTAQEVTEVHVSINMASAGIGALIGLVIGLIVLIIYYVARGTLNTASEFTDAFNVPVFGRVSHRRRMGKKALSPDVEKQMVFVAVKNFCKAHNVDRMLLSGSGTDLSKQEWLNGLKDALDKEQIETEIADSLTASPETLDKLSQFKHVTLVEKLHSSAYKDVVREIELCAEQDINVAGAIVVD